MARVCTFNLLLTRLQLYVDLIENSSTCDVVLDRPGFVMSAHFEDTHFEDTI